MRRVLLFVNPVFEQRVGHRDAIARIVTLMGGAGLSVEAHETLSARSAGEQARQGIADGFDTILVCGGDGTVFNVLQGVAGTEIPVGILPFGTGNVLAQNLNLPRDPVAAARILLDAHPRRIPLGKISIVAPEFRADGSRRTRREKSWYFTMTAGMGMHASLMNAAEGWGKHKVGRAAYFLGGIGLLMGHSIQPFEVEVTTPGGEVFRQRVCEAVAVRVSELNRWQPGGDLEGPFLRLATLDATGRWGLGKAAVQALTRRRVRDQDKTLVRYTDAIHVVCRQLPDYEYSTALLAEADGEVLGASNAVIEMTENSFQLLWPSAR